ncbi:MAG: hypothetical protein WB777_13015 [Mycobacterium sp.]
MPSDFSAAGRHVPSRARLDPPGKPAAPTTSTRPPSGHRDSKSGCGPPVDAQLASALTAYATDLTLIGTALRPIEGHAHSGNGTLFTSAVTSHTVWFHRRFRTGSWLLLRQHRVGARPLFRPRRRAH